MIQGLKKNLGWKIGSLALSVLIWLALASDPPVSTTVPASLQYKNIPRELEMSSEVLDRIHLEVHGPSNKLTPENLSDTAVVLDLRGVQRPGTQTFLIRQASINLPTGVELQRAIPSQVQLVFETRLSRNVPVTIRYGAQPQRGYEIVGHAVTPKEVRIIGPESRVRAVLAVDTDPIDLSGVVGSSSFKVQTFIPDPQVRFEGDGRVQVAIDVRKR